jgi:hypothetical protein
MVAVTRAKAHTLMVQQVWPGCPGMDAHSLRSVYEPEGISTRGGLKEVQIKRPGPRSLSDTSFYKQNNVSDHQKRTQSEAESTTFAMQEEVLGRSAICFAFSQQQQQQ